MDIRLWLAIVIAVITLLGGLVLGFLIARKFMMKYLKDNPPITEDIVRTMMSQMGRTPSEKQVRQVMKSINGQYQVGKK
ncbi:MAG: hypothetical protein K0Q49_808 [Haloplasmataceae bacterium]|jgi:uncharacterized protein YneF (UPF0154 family)|nr:hypothetical protein [Haloplasmataceae bacterium]